MASRDVYMLGACHHLAVALHRLAGMDLALVAGPTRDGLSVYHVACLDADGVAWDVRGNHAPADLLDEQEGLDGSVTWLVRLTGEEAVWRLAHGDDAKLHPISETLVEAAMRDARRFLGDRLVLSKLTPGPREPEAVDRARQGLSEMPDLGREAAWLPAPPSFPR